MIPQEFTNIYTRYSLNFMPFEILKFILKTEYPFKDEVYFTTIKTLIDL